MVSQENQSIVASVPADSLEVADPVDKKVSLDEQSAQDPVDKGQNEEKSAQKSVNPLDKGQNEEDPAQIVESKAPVPLVVGQLNTGSGKTVIL